MPGLSVGYLGGLVRKQLHTGLCQKAWGGRGWGEKHRLAWHMGDGVREQESRAERSLASVTKAAGRKEGRGWSPR